MPNPRRRLTLQKPLLAWYRRNKRDLPWRRTRDPYRILVSEFMLQQTQVATVIPYYRRFLKTFPTVSSLGRAPIQKVLKLWEGLGYYSRARNLHRAAGEILATREGKVPSRPEELASLPGIGRYTAGAIASIAFDIRTPILDGNVRRVLCRLFGIEEDPREPAVRDRLWKEAERILPDRNAGDFNQALMELGATVCLPRNPACPVCPVRISCQAFKHGLQDRLPVRAEVRAIPAHHMFVALIQNGTDLLIGPRPDHGLLAGLWNFPELDRKGRVGIRKVKEMIEKEIGVKVDWVRPLQPVLHTFSHKRVTYHPHLFRCDEANGRPALPWRWASPAEISSYPLPNAPRKILNQIGATHPLPLAAESSPRYDRAPV